MSILLYICCALRVKKLNEHTQSSKQLPSLLNPETSGRRKSVVSLPRKNSLDHIKNEGSAGNKIELLL